MRKRKGDVERVSSVEVRSAEVCGIYYAPNLVRVEDGEFLLFPLRDLFEELGVVDGEGIRIRLEVSRRG